MKKLKYLIILLLLTLLINIAVAMPSETGINVSNRNAQEKIVGRVVDVNEAPLAWKNSIGINHLTYFTLRVVDVETTSSGIKKGNLIKLVGEYYIQSGEGGLGISQRNLHKDDLIKVYANATSLRVENVDTIYMPVLGAYSIRLPDYEIPPGLPDQTAVEMGNNNSEEIIIGSPLVEGSSSEMEFIVGDMPEDALEQVYRDVSPEIAATWTLNKTDGIHRMPDVLIQNTSAIEPKWRNLTMLLYFNLKVGKVEKTSSGIKCGDTIKVVYIGYTYNNFGKEFYRLVNIKGEKALKIYANATSIRNNEGEIFYMPVFGGDSAIPIEEIPQTVASVSGRVTDFEQNPVDNASLTFKINYQDIISKTNESGEYVIKNIDIGCGQPSGVKIEADKHETEFENISLKEGMNEIDFILTPEKQSAAGFEVLSGMMAFFIVLRMKNMKK